MFRKQEGGTEEIYQGITLNFPRPGWVYDNLAGDWVYTGIHSRSSKSKDQYWEPIPIPEWYNAKAKKERLEIERLEDPDYFDEECEAVRNDFWFKRLNGMWIMVDGNPVYLTGSYFFYLNFWSIDVGLPLYRDSDRYNYYFREYCIQDPDCFGWIEVAGRRDGKTYKGTEFIYEYTSRTPFSNAGIQSKTLQDAKTVFSKLVSSFKKLPDFFKPIWDTSLGTTPKSEIRFYRTSIKGKLSGNQIGEELESVIDHRSSDTNAYDGYKLKRYLVDEVFKTIEVDIYKRHDAHRECLVDPISGKIIGKVLYTSTVDLVEGKMDTYRRFWKNSDQEKRNPNGRTTTGLYRHFRSAADSLQPDKYGRVDVEKNTRFILGELEGKKEDVLEYDAYKRRYPLSIEDAFRPSASNCLYDIQKLSDRLDLLNLFEKKYVTGDFRWINPDDYSQGVKFVEKKNGDFKLLKEIDYKHGEWNQVSYQGSMPTPRNKAKFVLGCDPFDHKTTVDNRKSNGAGAMFYKYDPMNPLKSDKFVLIYCARPPKPSIFYDNMLKACWFFGAAMLFEDNKQGILMYFNSVNASKFLITLPDRNEPGIPATVKTHEAISNHTMEYITDAIDLVDFPELISDWMEFDINNTTKFDLGMASGYTLLAANRMAPKVQKKETKLTEITEVFRIYN